MNERRKKACLPGESVSRQRHGRALPALFPLGVLAVIFAVEVVVSLSLSLMPSLSKQSSALLNASLLAALLLPLLYLYPFRRITGFMSEIEQVKKELDELSSKDVLTGIYNRAAFEEIIAMEMEKARSHDGFFSLAMLDLDRFKSVNDTYGYIAGDHVLKAAAGIIAKNIRQADYIIRWEGEEFIVVSPGVDKEGAIIQAERIRRAIENYSLDKVISITVSAGVAEFRRDDTEDSLIRRANSALYRAKTKGMNRVELEG